MKKVLIVDDAAFVRVTLRSMLERNGYEVIGEAANGADALIKYKMNRPDLVTMDITMPQMDGLSALQAIRQMDPTAKVVMISAMGQEHNVKDAIIKGAKGFILKPFQEEQVIKGLSVL